VKEGFTFSVDVCSYKSGDKKLPSTVYESLGGLEKAKALRRELLNKRKMKEQQVCYTHSLTYSLTHSLTYLLTYLLTHAHLGIR
jgi:hypothetical protein